MYPSEKQRACEGSGTALCIRRTRMDTDGRGRTRTDTDILISFLFYIFFFCIHISTGPIGARPYGGILAQSLCMYVCMYVCMD